MAQTLLTAHSAKQKYVALDVIGWGRFSEYEGVVKELFYQTEDLELTGLAITVMVRYFKNAKIVLPRYKQYLAGMPCDLIGSLKFEALYSAGQAFLQTQDQQILSEIVGNLKDPGGRYVDAARDALAEAMTPDWEHLAPHERSLARDKSRSVAHLLQAQLILSR